MRRNLVIAIMVVSALAVAAGEVFAAGMTIPASSSFNVNTGTLNVAGDITNAGTLLLTSGAVTLTGNWSNSGTFTAGTGTVNFTAGTGITQTLTSGGTGAGNLFYHLTHSGAGTLQLVTNAIDIDGDFTNSAGEFDANGLAVSCAGDWTNSATFTHGDSTLTFDGAAGQTVTSGASNTYNAIVVTNSHADGVSFADSFTAASLTDTTASSKLTFNAGDTYTITAASGLDLDGGAAGTEITVVSDLSGTAFIFDVTGGAQTVSYVNVRDSAASTNDITAGNSINSGGNDDTEASPHWIFGNVTRYWVGAANGDWDDNTNWSSASGGASGADVPSTGDTAIFDGNGDNPCTLDIATASLAALDIQAGYTSKLDANGNDITASGNVTVVAGATGELELGTNSQLTIGETLTVSGGSLDGLNGTIDAEASVSITGGELIAPSGNFNVAGNFSRTSGTFTHSSGTVVFDGAGATTVSGETTFYNLSCTTAGKQINFTAGTNQTVNNTLTLTGANGNLITLRSTVTDNKWDITLAGAAQTVSYINVKDADANTNTVTCYNSTNSGNNNANWVFNALGITTPAAGTTVSQTSTIIGTAGPGDTVTIKGTVGAVAFQTVAITTADANGNYRVAQSDFTASLDTGANNNIRADVGAVEGVAVAVTVSAAPTTNQVPTITSPTEGGSIRGSTPAIIGKGLAGQTVTLTANDDNGNLFLSDVAATTVDANGDWTISSTDYTTNLVKGTNYLSVTVGGVASNVRSVSLVDPFGVVFDSLTDNPIEGAIVTIFNSGGSQCTPGVEIAAADSNPQTTGADGAYSFLCANGNYYITITASGYTYPSPRTSFPAGRTIVTGSKGEIFTVAGVVIEMDHPMDSSSTLLKIKKDANKKEVNIGDVITYTVTIKNETASDVTNVYLEDKIPAGFKYISGKAILDNTQITEPTGNRPLTFNIGTVSAGTTKTLKYQLVVGSGVTFGNYENSAFAKYSDGTVISNKATETVKVVPDPLFSLGTIIGKVFWDKNENGIQDPPRTKDGQVIVEEPIPNVQIATEDGMLITTDKDGKYHLPAIIPGRHLLRLDERTLPQGVYLTTDKVVIVDITPGILAKVNFGVNSENRRQMTEDRSQKSNVKIMQEREKPIPRLNVSLFKNELIIEDGKLVEPAIFRIFTNYSLFIEKWKLEILDKDTKRLIRKFEGTRLTINEPINWDGKDKNGKPLRTDRNYFYVLTVTGKDGRQDVTKERKLIIREQKTEDKEQKSEKEIAKEKQEWLAQESKVNNLEKQNIRLEGETIKIQNLNSKIQNVRILKSGNLEGEVPVIDKEGLTAKDLLENKSGKGQDEQSEVEIILPKGEYDIEVIGASVSGQVSESVGGLTGERPTEVLSEVRGADQQANQTYTQHIKVGEDYLFFVAMGDVKAGYTFKRGNIEPVQQDDKFKEGFWSEGKLAYYLKGKIKGKYLITSSLDTERDKKELFRNLDPDKYYPVYGDSSSVNYDAANTQGPLYLLIEWDKSSVLWGNYETAFTDTEFAAFNRTLYGGKLHYESVSVTQFGEPHTKLIVFRARAQQRAAHNEFVGTGGSLFYLKNKDVTEGSDKVRLEVRDKITGLVLVSKDMEEGVDYEIDYPNGRLIFWQPVSYIVESDSIISSSLLGGNPVYIVVDYEYETKDKYDQGSIGGRLQQSLTDYLRVGGTYISEEQLDKNYELKGTDAILHLGKDITLTGEYAETQSEQVGSFISTDGGLSFTELPTADSDKGKAFGLKGQARLFDRLGLTAYYKRIEKGFSSAATTSQQGKELMGAGATVDITPKTRLKVSHDIQKLIDDGNTQSELQVGAKKTETTTVQLQSQLTEKLEATAEYRRQQVSGKKELYESETNTEEDTAAVRVDYKLTEKIDVSLEQQATLKGAANHQTTAGIQAKINEKLSLRAKETIGTQGTATSVGATVYPTRGKDANENDVKDKFEVSGDYTRADYKTGQESDTASVSAKAQLDEKTDVHTTLAITDSAEGGKTQSVVFGSERKINEELTLASSRTYAKNRDNLTQANTYGLTREKDGRRLEGTFAEQRSESDTEVSRTNIFGLSGDINDKWAAQGTFERGLVQNHDGTQATRNAASVGLGFVDKDKETEEVILKASGKLELRLDDGAVDKRQYLIYNAIEGKINPDTTIFAKANISQTKNTTTDSTEAQYKELVTGLAYRPVNFDRLNLLGKYTYLEDDSPSGQSDFSDIEKEKSHILAGEAVYDLTDKWQVMGKLAYKQGEEKVTGFDFTKTQTWLEIVRLNYNIDKDWQVGAEYRRLTQKQAEDVKQGALVEVARKIGEFIQVGLGYNFTDFNDDLTHLDYTAQGPFIRLTGKFYDRTPEEIERARQIWLEERIRLWAWQLVQDELVKPDSPVSYGLYHYYIKAKEFENKGKLNLAKEYYEKTLQIGKMIYAEAEEYVRKRIELETRLKKEHEVALEYYRQGRLLEAKQLWQKIKLEAGPEPVSLEF